MEKFSRNWCMAAACIIAALGCSKNENNILETSAVNQASTNYKYTVPTVPGYTPPKGVEPGPPIPFPIRPDTLTAGSPLYGYGGPNPDYLKNTCLFTISHLEEGSTYHQINNEKLNIAFYSADGERRPISVRRLKPTTPYPYGWTEHWNSPPFVENEHPEVLFTSDFETTFIIVFSKRCVKFGWNYRQTSKMYLVGLTVPGKISLATTLTPVLIFNYKRHLEQQSLPKKRRKDLWR
jgi:hypothetical protein